MDTLSSSEESSLIAWAGLYTSSFFTIFSLLFIHCTRHQWLSYGLVWRCNPIHERSRYHRSWPVDHFWLSPQCFWLSLHNAHFNNLDFKAVSYDSIPRFQFECLCLIMRKYLNNARGFHWLFIMVIIGIAFYLPFLIFGAFPYNTKINSCSD